MKERKSGIVFGGGGSIIGGAMCSMLVLEGSARIADVAWFDGGRCAASARSEPGAGWESALFDLIDRVASDAGAQIGDVEVLVAGRGPGQYTGMRLTIAAARGLAMPGHRSVFAVDSGDALAAETGRTEQAGTVAVVGDARRGQCWFGLFDRDGDAWMRRAPWSLADWRDLAGIIPREAVAVTPEWERVSSYVDSSDARWIRASRPATAEAVGRLALRRMNAGAKSEPLEPLYMHPAL